MVKPQAATAGKAGLAGRPGESEGRRRPASRPPQGPAVGAGQGV